MNRKFYLNILEVVLVLIFIFTLAVTSISNNTVINLALKLVSVIIYVIITIARLIFSDISLTTITSKIKTAFTQPPIKAQVKLTAIILFTSAITLTYSHNQGYGIWKLLNIIAVIIPFIFLTILNLSFEKESLLSKAKTVIEIYLFIVGTIIIFVNPFDFLPLEYKLNLERWSHVVIGRINSFLFLAYFLYLILRKEKTRFYEGILIIIVGYSIYLTGLRAAIFGLILLIPVMMLSLGVIVELRKRVYSLFFPVMLILALCIFIPSSSSGVDARVESGFKAFDLDNVNDGAINARLDGWMVGWEMVKDSPFIGRGLGGYNSEFRNFEIQKAIKYPHNLFVELVVELGLVGWVLIAMIIYLISRFLIIIWQDIFRSGRGDWEKWRWGELEMGGNGEREKLRKGELEKGGIGEMEMGGLVTGFILTIFSLWLAMFSKDVSSQSLLWVSLSVFSWQWAVFNKAKKQRQKLTTGSH